MDQIKFIIMGAPTVLKNSKKIIQLPIKGKRKCGLCGNKPSRPCLVSSDAATKAKASAVRQLWQQWEWPDSPIKEPVAAEMKFFVAMKSGARVDLSNLYQLYEDALQEVGIIEDDSQIYSHDGSRVVRMCGLEGDDACQKRGTYASGPRKGKRKDDCGAVKKCPHARVEITLRFEPERGKE